MRNQLLFVYFIKLSYGQSKSFELIHDPSGGYIMQHGAIKVFVKPDVPEGLNILLRKYADMLHELRSTSQAKETFHSLKVYISDYCDEPSIRNCSTLSDVIDILIDKLLIYIFNIETLTAICDHIAVKCSKIKVCVEKYKYHLHDFLSKTSVKEFIGTLKTEITNHSVVESVTLKLDESKIDSTLKALKKLVYHFFGNCSKALAHSNTVEGCVCITWLVPTSLIPTLKAMAKEHFQKYLASQGVLKLVIGPQVVPNEVNIEELQAKINSYQRMGRARDLEIFNLRKRNEELESELKTVYIPKEKSDYKVMYEQQQLLVKEVEKEKFEFEEKCAKLEMKMEKLQEKVVAKDEEFKIAYNQMCAFRERYGELEGKLTAERRGRLDLANNYATLERKLKTLQKQKFDLEEEFGDLKREVEIIEQKEKDSEKDQPIQCTGLLLYKQIAKNKATFHLVVVLNLEPHLQAVRKNYIEWYEDEMSLPIIFEPKSESVQLKLDHEEKESWDIFSLIIPPMITKSAVTDFQPGRRIPHCAIELKSHDENPQDLFYNVALIGATGLDSFYICYPQPESCKVSDKLSRERLQYMSSQNSSMIASVTSERSNSLSVTSPTSPNATSPIDTSTASRSLPSTPTCPLVDTKPDLATLSCFKYKDEEGITQRIYILDDIAAHWRRVGRSLKFQASTLDSIESTCKGDVEKCSERLLTLWLEGHVAGVPITWKTFTEAITDARLGKLADKLRKLFFNQP